MSDKKLTLIQKSTEELQEFIEAQQKVLMQLNKKLQKLESENIQLKIQLDRTPQVTTDKKNIFTTSDEESIAREQLYLLHQVSMTRELSYEECKKVDTFTKLLLAINSKEKGNDDAAKKEDTADLLKIVEQKDGNGK